MDASEAAGGGVLVVAPDAKDAERIVELLGDRGHRARYVADGGAALDEVVRRRFDVLVLDPDLPGAAGRDLVNVVRAYDVEVPILVLTSNAEPWIGAGVVLVSKPLDPEALGRAILRAKQSRNDTRKLRREVVSEAPPSTPEQLESLFARALDELYIAFQPIVHPGQADVFGYEALMRSRAPKMSTPLEILAAAETLGRLDELGRRVRKLAAAAFAGAPEGALLFVNLHSADLLDRALYDSSTALSSLAQRVVLEITERATIEHVEDVPARLSVLRFHGFRVAIDDLGAGYAGLTSFATVEPEFVKLDMSLVRNLHASPVRRRLVSSVLDACKDLGTRVVAEGVEAEDELRALRDIGCELFQGYLFAKPSPGFEKPARAFR
jgi:EAL domain-containing protein (putative c-di-GMP-specific phosphodiesterase class I)